jgi:hypothetical protein
MTALYVGQRQWGRSFLEGLLVAAYLDLSGLGWEIILAAGVLVAGATLWRKATALPALTLFGIVALCTGPAYSYLFPSPHSWNGNAKPVTIAPAKPTLVHLIMDEHIGAEGLQGSPEADAMKEELKNFYRNAGAVLYGGAYSQHMHTVNAIPHVLNFGRSLAQSSGMKGSVTGPTQYGQALIDRGYELRILTSDLADLCTNAVFHYCESYGSANLQPLLALPWTVPERAGLIALKFAALSDGVKWGVRLWNRITFPLNRLGARLARLNLNTFTATSSVSGLQAIEKLTKNLSRARPGQAYLAHILLPHYPYVVDSKCHYLR